MYNIMYETSHQSRFDARYWMLGAGALGRPRGMVWVAIQAYFKKQEKSQINNLTLYLKQLEKEEMKNPRVSRRKEILKIRAEINLETRPDSPGEPGMQPRDPYLPWRGKLGPGHTLR